MSSWLEHGTIPLGSPGGEALRLLKERVARWGLDQFSYILITPPRDWHVGRVDIHSTAITNFEQEWVDRYVEQEYVLLDPVVEQASREARPFLWPDSDSEDPRRRRMQEESREFGIAHGISFPLRDARGAVGMFTAVACDEERVRNAARCHGEELIATAFDAHEFAVDRACGKLTGKPEVDLTLRERECLLWTLEGKTAREVAALLHLSVFTVNRHAFNATRKLGGLSKHHAAVLALRAGLI